MGIKVRVTFGAELRHVRNTRVADIIRRNTAIGCEIVDAVFQVRRSSPPRRRSSRGIAFRHRRE